MLKKHTVRKEFLKKPAFSSLFLILALLTFFKSYLSFFIRFNLRVNFWRELKGRIHFPPLGSNFSIPLPSIKENELTDEKLYDWFKLLSALLFCYFLIQFPIKIFFEYFQRFCEKFLFTYLNKQLIFFVSKNKNLFIEKEEKEKLKLITYSISDFSYQLPYLFVNYLEIFLEIFWEIYFLSFFYKEQEDLKVFTFGFIFINLLWFSFFYLFSLKDSARETKQEDKRKTYYLLENLISSEHAGLDRTLSLLDKNYSYLSPLPSFSDLVSFHFLSRFSKLMIPATTITFLFFYCCYLISIKQKQNINWNLGVYLVALGCQNILRQIDKSFDLLSSFNSCFQNYSQFNKLSFVLI